MTNSRHNPLAPYAFLTPFLLLFAAFTLYPLLQSLLLSFEQTHGPRSAQFVGTANFSFILHDPLFWKALSNTAIFAAASVFIQLPISLALALLLNRPDIKGRALFRLIFFSPSLVGLVFVAVLFSVIFEKRTGLLNVALHSLFNFNLDFPWLQEHVMLAMILAALWVYVGFNMVYFLAALQNVDPELLDAAKVDGANPLHRFLHITLPAIRPVAAFVVLLSILGSFQLFELPFILLNGPGPDNQGLTIVLYLFQVGFQQGDLGYASAIGWCLAILLALFTLTQQLFAKTGRGDD